MQQTLFADNMAVYTENWIKHVFGSYKNSARYNIKD